MLIENLESRTLLTSTLVDGTLSLTTVSTVEEFRVTGTATTVTVDIIGENFTFTYPKGSVQRLVINCNNKAGNAPPGDLVQIDSSITFPTTINGSNGDDIFLLGGGPTVVFAGAGADYILAGAANDEIHGGGGRNQSQGVEAADDTIYGGAGDDQIFGDDGPNNIGDILMGQAGDDTIEGGGGGDLIDFGAGKDTLSYADKSGNGVNVYFWPPLGPSATYNSDLNTGYNPANALTSANFPYIGFGAVQFTNNAYIVNEHDQFMDGLAAYIATLPTLPDLNHPTVSLPVVTYTDLLTQSLVPNNTLLNNDNFEVIQGSAGHDLIEVSLKSIAYTIMGGDGVDEIYGGSGADTIDSGPNSGGGRYGVTIEFIDGGAGNDSLDGNTGTDSIQGGAGDDTINAGAGNDFILGDMPGLLSGFGNDLIDGGAGSDLMIGDDGLGSTDTTSAGGGNDTMLAGDSNTESDTLQGDGGVDVADYSMRSIGVTVTFDIEHNDGNPTVNGGLGERDLVTDSTEQVIGGSGDDVLGGGTDTKGRILDGGPGNDTLISGLGPDTLIGGDGTGDIADYSDRSTTIVVTFDGQPNDGDPLLVNGGPAGENDNVDSTVEIVDTGSGGGGGVIVPPTAPSNLTAATLSYTSVKLQWRDNANNETGFIIVRRKSTEPDYTVVTHLGPNVNQFTDTGLEPDTQYIYRVRAKNTAGNSAYSNVAKTTTRSAAVSSPSALTATAMSSKRIDVAWKDNASTETAFEIWRQTTSGGLFSLIGTVGPNATKFVDQTGLSPVTEYGYQVRAVNAFRASDFVGPSLATTLASDSLVAPSGLSVATQDDGTNSLSFQDNSDNETGFRIERAPIETGVFAQISTIGPNASSFTDLTSVADQVYLYRVRAFNATAVSSPSNVATSNLDVALGQPTQFDELPTAFDTILLTWADNAAIETAYLVERRIGSGGEWLQVASLGANVEQYLDTGLLPRTNYQYRVRATDGTNFSPYSRITSERTLAMFDSPPDAPSKFKGAALDSTTIKLFWQDNSNDETSFSIERATSLNGDFAVVGTGPEDKEFFIDDGLTPGRNYYYRVRAQKDASRSEPTRIIRVRSAEPQVVVNYATTVTGTEQGSNAVFTISRRGGTAGDLVVAYELGGSATNGTDYFSLPGTVTIPDGQAAVTVEVAPLADALVESDETVRLTVVNGTGYKASPSLATAEVTILDQVILSVPNTVAAASKASFSKTPIGPAIDLDELL